MTVQHRVVWSQGMFLQPHHFQQEARFFESLLDARLQAAHPYAWGFADLVVDETQLALGRLALVRAQGVLPDGTAFSMPDADTSPPAFDVPSDVQKEVVYLAAPRSRVGITEVDFGDGSGDELARWRTVDRELRDHTNAGDDAEPVQLGAVRLRLLRQRELSDAFAALGTCRVVERRADGQVVLDREYIAPQTRIDATGQLASTASLLHGLVQQRARTLASQMGQLSKEVSEIQDVITLMALNRSEPLLRQHAGAPIVHPWAFHATCLQLAGELATFSSAERVPPEFPLYRHDDLQRVFAPLVQALRELLSAVIERHAVQIELVARTHGVHTAVVADAELLRHAGFVLAVRAQLPTDQLRQDFPNKTKLGPVERIKELVNLQLPGVPMRSLPVAPRQLPFHAGSHYFDLERQGDLWKQIERSGSLALHVGGNFPGLELELWAVRQG